MTVLDDRGRLFGRVNLVDALGLGFVILLIPIAYGTWLLFRPKPVHITSVTRVTLSKIWKSFWFVMSGWLPFEPMFRMPPLLNMIWLIADVVSPRLTFRRPTVCAMFEP